MSYESLCDCLFNGDEPNFWSDSSAIMSNATPSTGGPRVASDSRGLAAREQGTALVMESAAQRPITSAARTRTQSATTARRCEPVTCTRNTSSLWRAASLTSFWAGLILAAICLLRGYQSHEAHTRSIEQIRPGQRVVVDAPEGAITADRQRSWKTLASDSPLDDIDPVSESIDRSQWRLVRLRSDKALSSGGVDEMWIDTLQPVQWLAAHGVRVGGEAPIPLDLAEMGVPPEQTGRVIDIQPCPPIESGTGRVVLTTVNHLNQDVRELTLRDAKGREEAVRPTGLHKFYSVTRGQWLSASELQLGERLDGLSGVVTVTGVRSIPGTHRVYNMTVQGQHFYRVANCGVLTHNAGCWEAASKVGAAAQQEVRLFKSFNALKNELGPAGEGQVWHHIVEQRAANIEQFGAEAIHNTQNVVSVSREVNQSLANYYSTVQPFTQGQTVRQWLGSQSWRQQFDYGQQMLNKALSGQPLP